MRNALIKTLIVIAAIAPLVWLSLRAAAPGGERVVTWSPGERSPFVQSLLPAERVSEVKKDWNGDAYVTIQNEPVYFSAFAPSPDFSSVTVDVAFQPRDAFALELGGMTNVAAYAFDFRALSNRAVEQLDWTVLPDLSNDRATMVFAKDDVRATESDFFKNMPNRAAIATYRITLPGVYREPSYVPLGRAQTFHVSLRGSHEYLTYIKNEPFSLTLTYHDINRTFGEDNGFVRVVNEAGETMREVAIVDDGNSSQDQRYALQTLTIEGRDWSEGVYRVILSGTSDVMWRTIVTTQRYVTFKNRLFIGDDVGYLPEDRITDFLTNSASVTLETFHADSAQHVTIGSQQVLIPKSHEKHSVMIADGGIVQGRTDAGDVKITGDGKFSLSRASFFDPDPRTLTVTTNLDDPAVRYLVASVPPVSVESDGWRRAATTFDLAALEQENGAYKFALSLPGFMADQHTVDIHSINMTFHKAPMSLAEAVVQELRRWRDALRDRLFVL